VISATCAGGSSPPCTSCTNTYTLLNNLCVLSASLSPYCANFNSG
jgi:hypothetical protein